MVILYSGGVGYFSMFPKGQTYANYKLLSGAFPGYFGEVYHALHLPTNKDVAVKFSKNPHHKHWYKRFKDENKYLHQLNPHEHIIKAYTNVTHDGNHAFYAMEYLEHDLEKHLGNIPSTNTAEKLKLFEQICNGLKHAHSKGIYHRDLHPGNIRMDAGKAKLVDFGLGKDMTAQNSFGFSGWIWFGAVHPPESTFCVSDEPTHEEYLRRDTYALGIILYTIFASSNVPYLLAVKGNIQQYFADLNMDYFKGYLKLSEADRRGHYAAWLRGTDPNLSDKLNVSLTDVDLADKISTIVKKACDIQETNRYATVDDLVQDIRGL